MIKKGIYAASLSVLNDDGSLNINETDIYKNYYPIDD